MTIIFGNNKFYSITSWNNGFYSIYEKKPGYREPYIYNNCYHVRKNELIEWLLNKQDYFLDPIKFVNHWKAFAKANKFKRINLKLLKATAEHLGNPRFINFNV